ncbi:Sec-independent protein translocase family protein [Mycetocola spongiae]|uniref:Sec-independent protein translocase TatB n=1 Tax=Mycetocola spongiae TaxID=2859226 RepID=UPI001CF107FD|nr:Sec-independent protein translocase TatB [Mycetocola spongiae]UCR89050.1 Sec-independent protein translocase TatB [Mycetocola spongiae]
MFLGLTFDKLLIIGVLAAFLVGPEKLPGLASQLARLVRSLRDMATGAKDRLKDDMGPEYNEVDWQKLDPRQYDPRRIIREALTEDPQAADAAPTPAGSAATGVAAGFTAGSTVPAADQRPRIDPLAVQRQRAILAGEPVEPPPFDTEAT